MFLGAHLFVFIIVVKLQFQLELLEGYCIIKLCKRISMEAHVVLTIGLKTKFILVNIVR